jgi:L-threonylcarbamoyladenylate synthase
MDKNFKNILEEGGLIIFPTETVYGIGCKFDHEEAINKVFKLKNRPLSHPLIVHIGSKRLLHKYAVDIPKNALTLAEEFWPGPLTMILKKNNIVKSVVTGGQETVGIRMPNHPVTLNIINKLGSAIVGPSANYYSRLSSTRISDISESIKNAVDIVIDGGHCDIGIESTIIDFSTHGTYSILREGMITLQQIEAVIGKPENIYKKLNADVRHPGGVSFHYSPLTPLTILLRDEINRFIVKAKEKKIAVLSRISRPIHSYASVWQIAPHTPREYAANMYNFLARLDKSGCDLIVVEAVPDNSEWTAVKDRLFKAKVSDTVLESIFNKKNNY